MSSGERPLLRIDLRATGIAGLVLIPVGIAALLADLDVAGTVLICAGWLLTIGALIAIGLLTRRGHIEQPARRPSGGPTFILATALAGAGLATKEPIGGLAIAYVAIAWFYARFII